MDTRFLESLMAVARFSNLTAASNILNLAPTAVSRQIRLIEEEFGHELFERSSRGMRLTAEGLVVRDRGARLLQELERLKEDVAAMSGHVTGVIEVGTLQSCETTILRDAAIAFRIAYPKAELRIYSSSGRQVERDLRAGLLDIAVLYDVPEESEGLTVRPVIKERLLLAGCARHGLRMDQPVPLGDLEKLNLAMSSEGLGLRTKLDRLWSKRFKRSVADRIVMQANSIQLMLSMLPGTDLFSVLPEIAVRDMVRDGLLSAAPFDNEPELDRTISICRSIDRPGGHSSRLFEQELVQHFQAL